MSHFYKKKNNTLHTEKEKPVSLPITILKPLQCVWGRFVILYIGRFFCC